MTTKKDKREGQRYNSPIFGGMGLVAVVCFMLLFVGIGIASATDYYVSVSGKNSDDGTTLDTAWRTITYAATKAQAGDTVHIKGGNYGHEHVVIKNSGTAAKPIVFEGFDGTPVIDGQYETRIGIRIKNKNYITLRNLEVNRYYINIDVDNSDYIFMEDLGVFDGDENGIFIWQSDNCTLKNSNVSGNAKHNIFNKCSDYTHIENCTAYTTRSETNRVASDYYIIVAYSHHVTVKNCVGRNMHGTVDVHPGHCIGIIDNEAQGFAKSYNNKIINCECHASDESFYVAHGAYNNEFINCKSYRDNLLEGSDKGFTVRDGAYNNTFTNCMSDGHRNGAAFTDTTESTGTPYNQNNIFEKCIFKNADRGIYYKYAKDNQFINCIFTGGSYMTDSGVDSNDNIIKNCIITDISSFGYANPTITYSDFWNNGFSMPSGTGNMKADPLFADPENSNYHLRSNSPCRGVGEGSVDMGAYPEGESRDVGTISGTVTDGTDPIQGATVTANGYSDGTDSNGYYEIPNVPVGLHTVTASATGYYPESQEDIQVSKDQTTTVDFQFPLAEEAPEAPDLIGNWQFDEGKGTTAYDSSGNNNNGTITGASWATEGMLGSALSFDGVDDYIDCGNDPSLDVTEEITIIARINPISLGESDYPRIVTKGDNPFEVVYLANNRLGFELIDVDGSKHTIYSNIDSVPLNQWSHCALVYDSAVQKIYINGVQDPNIVEWTNKIGTTENKLYIGNRGDTERTFHGVIDGVKIYNRDLSVEEIKADYEAGSEDKTPPDTRITSGPEGRIDYKDVTFMWDGSDDATPASQLLYSYKLEGYDDTWSSWTSAKTISYNDLPNGDYTFTVKTKDEAGNEDPTPAELSFIVSVKK